MTDKEAIKRFKASVGYWTDMIREEKRKNRSVEYIENAEEIISQYSLAISALEKQEAKNECENCIHWIQQDEEWKMMNAGKCNELWKQFADLPRLYETPSGFGCVRFAKKKKEVDHG